MKRTRSRPENYFKLSGFYRTTLCCTLCSHDLGGPLTALSGRQSMSFIVPRQEAKKLGGEDGIPAAEKSTKSSAFIVASWSIANIALSVSLVTVNKILMQKWVQEHVQADVTCNTMFPSCLSRLTARFPFPTDMASRMSSRSPSATLSRRRFSSNSLRGWDGSEHL